MFKTDCELYNKGLCRLLAVKDSDIRILTLKQGDLAVDRGIHIGGAFSSIIPMVSLFYSGIMNLDPDNPTLPGQDIFVLSKGHAVSSMASIYADLGYFDSSLLSNSRSVESILNGHPGPLLRGVQIATGPLGQGLAVAQGFAMAGKSEPLFKVFCITGDGELQEGVVWEAFMHAPQKKLDNLCVLIDKNEGQLDNHAQLIFPMSNLPKQVEAFGWRVFEVDGTSYEALLEALEKFSSNPGNGKPTAIVCNTKKGFGAFSAEMNKHKITLGHDLFEQELVLQENQRRERCLDFVNYLQYLKNQGREEVAEKLSQAAVSMNLELKLADKTLVQRMKKPQSGKVPEINKEIRYDHSLLPRYAKDAQVAANEVIKKCMTLFARDPRVVTVDADLGTTSGLEGGIAAVDQRRAINVGIAESNMMCVGEAYAALGYNAWVSTFCPFFDWKVLRRIAVGAQERRESMASPEGWLSSGHGLDLTFLATASNFDTGVNGATHMGNDDIVVYAGIAGLNIIDVSCPNQLVGILEWIMKGNRGLNYLRIMRAASGVIYDPDFKFEYGKAYRVHGEDSAKVYLISSGRGVHEVLGAAKLLKEKGVSVTVFDMPSYDEGKMLDLAATGSLIFVVEQNNGFIWNQFGRSLLRLKPKVEKVDLNRIFSRNANTPEGEYQYIHSATYKQLIARFGLTPEKITEMVLEKIR